MSMSTVSAALQDALEKGDVVELEQAIVAAEDAMHLSPHSRKTSSSSIGNLIARAKDMYLVHMDACRPYVKPLRKACKELNERGIFEALVRARGAPDEVQLCMYTDLCNAESLRHEIVEAQKVAVQLLDATSSADVDNFLSECSPFLEDRTILSLVQKREDLLREERRREAGRMTPLRSASRGGGSAVRSYRRDPVEDLGRHEWDDEGVSPVHAAGRYATPSRAAPSGASRHLLDSGRRAATPVEDVTPRSLHAAPAAYPAIRHAVEQVRDSGLQRAVTSGGASPWMQAMASLRQQVYEEVAREERGARQQLEEGEIGSRAVLYRNEMLERVRCWANTTLFAASAGDEKASEDGEYVEGALSDSDTAAAPRQAEAPRAERQPASTSALKADASWVRLPLAPPTTRGTAAAAAAPPLPPTAASGEKRAGNTPTRVYAHSLADYPLRPSPQQHHQQQQQQLIPSTLTRATRSAAMEEGTGALASSSSPAASADGAILGSALRGRLAAPSPTLAAAAAVLQQHTPRISRDTPNISPIKEVSTASGVASMYDTDGLYQRGETKHGWADAASGSEPDATPRPRDSVGSVGVNSVASAVAPTLELRRIQARLRAVLQEEDIHRRDIEGTEDFDRSVFLFPVSARIAMLRRTATNRLRLY